jgi:hypothetical protein
VNADMPGWDSLETVTRIHGATQIAGLILLALLVVGSVLLFFQLRRGAWPEWIDVGDYQIRSLALEIAGAAVLALLVVTTLLSYGYGSRHVALTAAAERVQADQPRRLADQAAARPTGTEARQVDEAKTREADQAKSRNASEDSTQQQQHLRELADLRRKLTDTENQLADLRRKPSDTENQLPDLRRKLTEAENQVTELRSKLSESENRLAGLQAKPSETKPSETKPSETESRLAELQRKLSQAESQLADLRRTPSENGTQLSELRRKLVETESQLAELQRKQVQKRLSADEKKLLIESLKPFAGQKIAIASRVGDEDGKALAEDFIAVLDAAGWTHGGNAGVSFRRWDRDPVGVEITLNEADARAGRISNGIGALINTVRKLGLTYDNTIYMNREVPAGLALLKIGRKLPKQ